MNSCTFRKLCFRDSIILVTHGCAQESQMCGKHATLSSEQFIELLNKIFLKRLHVFFAEDHI